MSTYSINIAGMNFEIDINAAAYTTDEELFDALYERAMNLHEAADFYPTQADVEADALDPDVADLGNVLAAWSAINA